MASKRTPLLRRQTRLDKIKPLWRSCHSSYALYNLPWPSPIYLTEAIVYFLGVLFFFPFFSPLVFLFITIHLLLDRLSKATQHNPIPVNSQEDY